MTVIGEERALQAAEFERLYRENFETVYKRILSKARDVREAEEVVSAAFQRAARGFERFDPSLHEFSSWVCAMAETLMDRSPGQIRGAIVYEDGTETKLVFSRTLADGSLRVVDHIVLDGECYERASVAQTLATEAPNAREAELAKALEDVLRCAPDTVWVGEGETLVDRMVRLGLYGQEVYDGARPWGDA